MIDGGTIIGFVVGIVVGCIIKPLVVKILRALGLMKKA